MTNGYAPINVRVTTKARLDKEKKAGESYGDTIDRLIAESKKVVLEA